VDLQNASRQITKLLTLFNVGIWNFCDSTLRSCTDQQECSPTATCCPGTTPRQTNGERQKKIQKRQKKRKERKLTPLTQNPLPFRLQFQKTQAPIPRKPEGHWSEHSQQDDASADLRPSENSFDDRNRSGDRNCGNDGIKGLQPLSVRITDEHEHWQLQIDAPNLKTFLSRLERQRERQDRQEEPLEWTVTPLTHQLFLSSTSQEHLKQVINTGKALNSEALTCIWTTTDKKTEERQAATVKEWTEAIGWDTEVGQIRNAQHDRHPEGRSTFLIAADKRTIDKLSKEFEETDDGFHHLEQILDLADGNVKDSFSHFTATDEDREPSGNGSVMKTPAKIKHSDTMKDINAFDITNIGPALASMPSKPPTASLHKRPDQCVDTNC
jgi:hypothetical protein